MHLSHESSKQSQRERAYFAALVALNAKIEAARAGKPNLAYSAQSCESLMQAFLAEIQSAEPVK